MTRDLHNLTGLEGLVCMCVHVGRCVHACEDVLRAWVREKGVRACVCVCVCAPVFRMRVCSREEVCVCVCFCDCC